MYKHLYLYIIALIIFHDISTFALTISNDQSIDEENNICSWRRLDTAFFRECTAEHQRSIQNAIANTEYTRLFFGISSSSTGSNGMIADANPTRHLKFVKILGQGAFGMVCETISSSGNRIATKLLPTMCNLNGRFYPGLFGGNEIASKNIRSAISEILCLAICDHPVIPKLISAAMYNSIIFINEEFVRGGNPMNNPNLKHNLEVITVVSYQLLDALVHLRDLGIIHRDIKPLNIIIYYNPSAGELEVKLLDFGIAAFRGQSIQDPWYTPRYSPPRKTRLFLADSKYDIYSLGVTMYEIFMQEPYKGNLDSEYLPDDFRDLLFNMLALDEVNRFTVDECMNHRFFSFMTQDFKEMLHTSGGKVEVKVIQQDAINAINELDKRESKDRVETGKEGADEEMEAASEQEDGSDDTSVSRKRHKISSSTAKPPTKKARRDTTGESTIFISECSVKTKAITPEEDPIPIFLPEVKKAPVHQLEFSTVFTPLKPKTKAGSRPKRGSRTSIDTSPFKAARKSVERTNMGFFRALNHPIATLLTTGFDESS